MGTHSRRSDETFAWRASGLRLGLLLALFGLFASPLSAEAASFKNVILMIGDGMGFEHVKAARLYNGGPLSFESAPHQASMTTDSVSANADGTQGLGLTDSAASATAMATGVKVNNTVVSKRIPGDLSDLPTSLEHHKANGKRTGLVTTSYMIDATPSAFASHSFLRGLNTLIATQYLNVSRPNVLFGAAERGVTPDAATAAGYTVVRNRAELQALDTTSEEHVSGIFGEAPEFGNKEMPFVYDYSLGLNDAYDTLPFLFEMTEVALALLQGDPDGFFLMVEQENTDSAGHLPNDDPLKTGRDVFASLEFSRAVQSVLDWMSGRDDTLLIVAADHETGGPEVLSDNGPGNLPTVDWAGTFHTRSTVPVYAWGPGAERVTGVIDNTDIFRITVPEPGALLLLATGVAALARRGRRFPQLPRSS